MDAEVQIITLPYTYQNNILYLLLLLISTIKKVRWLTAN